MRDITHTQCTLYLCECSPPYQWQSSVYYRLTIDESSRHIIALHYVPGSTGKWDPDEHVGTHTIQSGFSTRYKLSYNVPVQSDPCCHLYYYFHIRCLWGLPYWNLCANYKKQMSTNRWGWLLTSTDRCIVLGIITVDCQSLELFDKPLWSSSLCACIVWFAQYKLYSYISVKCTLRPVCNQAATRINSLNAWWNLIWVSTDVSLENGLHVAVSSHVKESQHIITIVLFLILEVIISLPVLQ